MTYVYLGPDEAQKDEAIYKLRHKLIPPAAQSFDFVVLDAHRLDADHLREELLNLPALAKKRLLLLRSCHKLHARQKNMVVSFLRTSPDHVVVALESSEMRAGDAFLRKFKPKPEIMDTGGKERRTVFDVTRLLGRRRPAEALKMLSELMGEGQHPLQLMGGLVWFWGRLQSKLQPAAFHAGLAALEEADLNIKRSRLRPETAVEIVIIKLHQILCG